MRIAEKPLTISEQIARAPARFKGSAGHRRASGNASATYSQIASDSWIAVPSTRSTGKSPRTLPSLRRSASDVVSLWRAMCGNATVSVSNGAPVWYSTSHGRIDHDE